MSFPLDSVHVPSKKQRLILEKLSPFYTEERIRSVLLPLIHRTDSVSLRALEWVCTNYSKKHNIVCDAKEGVFNIHDGYTLSLSHFRRRNFDPFRRRERIKVVYGEEEGEWVETTVGQLNFVHFAHERGVISFTRVNLDDIERDMNETNARCKEEKLSGKVKKRHRELSSAPSGKCFVFSSEGSVEF